MRSSRTFGVLRQGDRLTESAPLAPLTPYASNKALADRLLRAQADRAGVQWINLRLFNVFGRYERPTRLLPTLVSQLAQGEVARLTHGTQVRDFTDVDVAAGAFVAALAAPRKACGALYHIGSGQGTTVREFALAVADVVGSRGLIRFGSSVADDADIPCLVADPSRAIEAIGWTPDLDLRTRIAEAVHWWLRQLKAETTGKVMA
jgi:nucleoside-diphosphate-sugar epimerase